MSITDILAYCLIAIAIAYYVFSIIWTIRKHTEHYNLFLSDFLWSFILSPFFLLGDIITGVRDLWYIHGPAINLDPVIIRSRRP